MHTALVAFMLTLNRFLLYQWTDGILTHSISLEYIHITFNSHPDFGQKNETRGAVLPEKPKDSDLKKKLLGNFI